MNILTFMHKLKIGIFDPYLNDIGGGEKYIMTLASCIAKDYDVDVFWDTQKDLDLISERFSINVSNIKRVENIFSSKVNTIKRSLISKKYDAIIYVSDGSIPFLLSKKLFIHIQQPLHNFQKLSKKDKLKLSRVTRFFCNSEFTKSFISKKFGINPVVIYPPIELHHTDTKKENIILHVGRFRVQDLLTGAKDFKKQYVMVQSFKEMIDEGLKKWKLVLAVSLQEKDKVEFEKMRKSAQGYPIEFLLNETNQALWEVYSRSKIYWHASGYGEDLETHPEYAEHFGISTVEAMGAGCVPVVINAGGQKEIVTNSKNGFVWNTLDELKEKTLELTNNSTLLNTLSKNAQERAQYFAGDRFCKDIQSLITVSHKKVRNE